MQTVGCPIILQNGYYFYHYNYLTTQLLDNLTRSALTKNQKFWEIGINIVPQLSENAQLDLKA